MSPFFNIFGFNLPAYGLMTVAGFAAAALVLFLRNRAFKLVGDDVLNTAICAAVGVAVGGKILYLIVSIPIFIKYASIIFSSFEMFEIFFVQGSVFYGGLIGALLFSYLYLKKNKLDIKQYGDLFAPAIPVFHMFGRLGCYFAGCCYGVPWEHGIVFHDSLGAPNDIALFPTQLVEVGFNALIFIALMIIGRFCATKGRLILYYLLMYAPFRFVNEFFRGDEIRGVWLLSTSQWVSIGLFAFTVFLFLRGRKARVADGEEKPESDDDSGDGKQET